MVFMAYKTLSSSQKAEAWSNRRSQQSQNSKFFSAHHSMLPRIQMEHLDGWKWKRTVLDDKYQHVEWEYRQPVLSGGN